MEYRNGGSLLHSMCTKLCIHVGTQLLPFNPEILETTPPPPKPFHPTQLCLRASHWFLILFPFFIEFIIPEVFHFRLYSRCWLFQRQALRAWPLDHYSGLSSWMVLIHPDHGCRLDLFFPELTRYHCPVAPNSRLESGLGWSRASSNVSLLSVRDRGNPFVFFQNRDSALFLGGVVTLWTPSSIW